jgi:glucosamine kinase
MDDAGVVSVETGSANVSTDFAASLHEIRSGLEALAERLEVTLDDLCARPAFVGLAGVTGPVLAEKLRASLPFKRVRIEDDRPAALRGALGSADGFLAHCGTGSFFGAQVAGSSRLIGGWGPVLGDDASAQWIGRTALTAVLDCVDGLCPMSEFAECMLRDFDGAAEIVRFAGDAAPAEFGALARRVTAAASQGDPVAIGVMRRGATRVAEILVSLGWRPGFPICLTGGIGPQFPLYLPDEMRDHVADPKATPLDGALELAGDLAKEAAA